MYFLKRTISAAASVLLALSMTASRQPQTIALDEPLDIHLTIETKEIGIADIPDDRAVSLEVYVENSLPFAGMWMFFEKDPRLEFNQVRPFSIVDGVKNANPLNTLSYFEVEPHKYGCCIPAKMGKLIEHSGAIVRVNVFLPADAEVGDFYSMDFNKYIGNTSMVVDLGYEMSDRYYESSFTQLNSGGILITEKTPPTEPTTISPAEQDFKLGDVNNDSKIDSSDASLILAEFSRIQTGALSPFTDEQIKAADVNLDEKIDSSDASMLLAYYAYVQTGGEIVDFKVWYDTVWKTLSAA